MSLFDITDLSAADLARLADSPLAEALSETDSEPNRMQFNNSSH